TVPSIVQVHLLDVAELVERFPERGQRQLQWFSPHEAAAHVREPELKSLLRGVEAALAPDK
ncbi:DNA mismatch repair protein MutT, partial [Rhizobium sp. P40RR-XXII]|nr:DNA mismatch repair protein MutT [Rhizobium sp. P40RR-XXII]